jgi:LysM repeat protein
MKILQIFGVVVAVHLLAFIFIFASPGCSSGPRTMPTPDATVPTASAAVPEPLPAYNSAAVNPQPVDLGTPAPSYTPVSISGHATPTRPGSAAAVAVTPAQPVENVAPVSTYTVLRGDSLWSIAKKNSLSVSELAKANSLTTGTALKPGRKLIIPGKVGAAPKEHAAVPPAGMSLPAEKAALPARPAGDAVKHTVQVGESLGTIARKYQVNPGELAAANNITDPSKIRAGQQLVIPGGKAVTSKAATPAPKSSPAAKAPAATKAPADSTAKPAETPAPADKNAGPHFDLSPPPPGQDLDSGLKAAETEVPTIKVEEAKPATPAKN